MKMIAPSKSIAILRIAIGFSILYDLYTVVASNGLKTIYQDPIRFYYLGFEWVPLPPSPYLEILISTIAISALLVTLGFLYRGAIITLCISHTWFLLMDATKYNNHWYLFSLLAFILIFIPAHSRWSIDYFWFKKIRQLSVKLSHVYILRLQLGIVYTYGAIAKINPDWLAGQPISRWIREVDFQWEWLDRFVGETYIGLAYAYGGLFFDLLAIPLILYSKTRWLSIIMMLFFHIHNATYFDIGSFPYLMIATIVLFLPQKKQLTPIPSQKSNKWHPLLSFSTIAWVIYFIWQILMPIRHFAYPGATSWTSEAQRFSWHMMLNNKNCYGHFIVVDKQTRGISIEYPHQLVGRESTNGALSTPQFTLQMAHYLGARYKKELGLDVEVYALIKCTLNYRDAQYLVDPTVDLMNKQWTLKPFDWLIPLENKNE